MGSSPDGLYPRDWSSEYMLWKTVFHVLYDTERKKYTSEIDFLYLVSERCPHGIIWTIASIPAVGNTGFNVHRLICVLLYWDLRVRVEQACRMRYLGFRTSLYGRRQVRRVSVTTNGNPSEPIKLFLLESLKLRQPFPYWAQDSSISTPRYLLGIRDVIHSIEPLSVMWT